MKRLTIRKPPFSFPADTPYLWQPRNPDFSELCNAISFVGPPFERYIVNIVQESQSRLAGTPMEQEAIDFLRQEAQHARMHRRHVAVMVKKYPALADLTPQLDQAYNDLLQSESLEFNLAYVADIEATFTPLFGTMLDNEHVLFRGGAEPVPSLFVWHFMEEIEHRSSALGIYNTVVADPWYRVKVLPKVIDHVSKLMTVALDALAATVPATDRGDVSGRGLSPRSPAFRDIPLRDKASMLYRLTLTQLPYHRPEHQPLPKFAAQWLDAETSGRDITSLYAPA